MMGPVKGVVINYVKDENVNKKMKPVSLVAGRISGFNKED